MSLLYLFYAFISMPPPDALGRHAYAVKAQRRFRGGCRCAMRAMPADVVCFRCVRRGLR